MIEDGEVVEAEGPRPLHRELPSPAPFPIAALGTNGGAVAASIRDLVQVPDSLAGNSVLAVLSLTAQRHVDVQLPHGAVRPTSMDLATSAASGDRKSAADDIALRPVRHREAELYEGHAETKERALNELDMWESERKRIVGQKDVPFSEKRDKIADLGPRPKVPPAPILVCTEPTFEGLTRLYQEGHHALGLFSAEGGQFLGGFAMGDEQRLKTAAGLSLLWDGAPLVRTRQGGDGTIVLPNRRLSVHLMFQPRLVQRIAGNAELVDQGWPSRILLAAPESLSGTRFYREPNAQDIRILNRYEALLLDLLRAALPMDEETLQPRPLSFSPEARQAWIQYHDSIERRLGPNGPLASVRGFANKAAEHAGRIAAVLNFVDEPDSGTIDREHTEAGIALAEFYVSEWVRLMDAPVLAGEIGEAAKLLDWLHSSWDGGVIGLPEVYTSGPNSIREASKARQAMRVLEDHGHVTPIERGATVGDKFRREAWQIVRS